MDVFSNNKPGILMKPTMRYDQPSLQQAATRYTENITGISTVWVTQHLSGLFRKTGPESTQFKFRALADKHTQHVWVSDQLRTELWLRTARINKKDYWATSTLLNTKFDLLQYDSKNPPSTNLPTIIRQRIQQKLSKNKRVNFLPWTTIQQFSGSQTERRSIKQRMSSNSVISHSPQRLSHCLCPANYFPTCRGLTKRSTLCPCSHMQCTFCVSSRDGPWVTCGSALVFFGRTRHMSQGREGGPSSSGGVDYTLFVGQAANSWRVNSWECPHESHIYVRPVFRKRQLFQPTRNKPLDQLADRT